MRCLHRIALSMALGSMWKRRWKSCQNQRWWAILRKYHFQTQQGRYTQELGESVKHVQDSRKQADNSQHESSYNLWAQRPTPTKILFIIYSFQEMKDSFLKFEYTGYMCIYPLTPQKTSCTEVAGQYKPNSVFQLFSLRDREKDHEIGQVGSNKGDGERWRMENVVIRI